MHALQPHDPRRIGTHALIARLGNGGMGQVYLGRSPGGRSVAIKVIHRALVDQPGFRARFHREVAAAGSVSGAFTAPVIDADPEADTPWLATTYLPGISLFDAVSTYGPLPVPAVCALGAALAEALISIHRAGVVHRDLKPSNVLITAEGPKVIDFGIAHIGDATAITRSGGILGSPGYLAPEQAAGAQAGPATDVFALGATLVFAATGAIPFGPGPVPVVVRRTLHEAPDLRGVPDPGLRRLLASCLDKDPSRRPSPADLVTWLAVADHGTAWLPRSVADAVTQRAMLPPPSPPAPPYASWGRRATAALIDGLCVTVPLLAALVFTVVADPVFTVGALHGRAGGMGSRVVVIGYIAALLAEPAIALWLAYREGTTGQSPGKRRLGIRLERADTGTPIGFGQAIVRRLVHILDALPCYLGFLWPLWDERRQTFADKVTATVVVRGS